MGILDFFKSGKPKNLNKYGEVLRKVVTTKEQRLEAIEALRKEDAQIAIPQLLKRFEIVIDSGMQDTREKEIVSELILDQKEAAKEHVIAGLKSARRISWFIKLAEKLFSQNDYVSLLLDNLSDEFVGFDETVQERNIEIMLALKDVQDARIVNRVAPHFASRDENVRIAALECLEAQAAYAEEARSLLKSKLTEPMTDDNSRFLGLIRGTVEKHGW